MRSNKVYIAYGVISGIILSFFYFHYFAPRYEITGSGLSLVKTDKWTGQSWRLVNDSWKSVVDAGKEWKEIDQTLADALNIPLEDAKTRTALSLLREKYPILKGIPDDDLLERIKLVYSKQILASMYVDSFLKLEDAKVQKQTN